MNRNLCKTVISEGGSITPLLINPKDSKGLGLMNPSIFIDNGRILLNLRNINYTLYHCEGQQLFNNRWGPLSYLHPENDMHLRTWNYMCELDPNSFEITNYSLTDTAQFDKDPLWDFVGLEDARLFKWDGKYYQCGVRRDTTPNGVGRMELSEIEEIKTGQWKEISRTRIEPPGNPTYCEKNWMPVVDMPWHFVKWTNPTEVVKVDPSTKSSTTVYLGEKLIPNVRDLRGGSQVIPWKNYHIALLHEVDMIKNRLEQKDATYLHRFIAWDKDWNVVGFSDSFSFMDGEIEFCCGLSTYNKDLLVTFGFQDNAAYLLRIPHIMIHDLLNLTEDRFDWGVMHNQLRIDVSKEIVENDVYQKFFKVEKDDVVVDIGASVGPFTYSILDNEPSKVFCVEPSKKLFPTLSKNINANNVICINKGIGSKNEIASLECIYNDDNNEEKEKDSELITFKSFVETYNIEKIDFLKTDCEGCEYDIFNEENFEWITKNVKKIVGEFHITSEDQKQKMIKFKNTYLKHFTNFKVLSQDGGQDVKWDLLNHDNLWGMILIYIDNTKSNYDISTEKWRKAKWPSFEITTSIPEKGCVMSCVFCPQQTLLHAYKGERKLSLENFKTAIDKIPKEVTIIFSGFVEPWLNSDATEMAIYAHETGHAISIFTTGIGMTIEDIEKIKTLRFSIGPENPLIGTNGIPMINGGFVLHLPDNENYAHHPITEYYINFLEYVNSIKLEIPGFRVVCMGTIHDSIKHIFQHADHMELWARADNLVKEETYRPELANIRSKYLRIFHEDVPMTCNADEELYHNVLLPNGDVVLCCMDYNLDHILGNIFTQDYNDILPEYKTPFKLCRFCENGIPVKFKK